MPTEAAGVNYAAVMNHHTEDIGRPGTWPGIDKCPVQPAVCASGQAAIGSDEYVRGVLGIKSDPKGRGLDEVCAEGAERRRRRIGRSRSDPSGAAVAADIDAGKATHSAIVDRGCDHKIWICGADLNVEHAGGQMAIQSHPGASGIRAPKEAAELAGRIKNAVGGAAQVIDAAAGRVHAADV